MQNRKYKKTIYQLSSMHPINDSRMKEMTHVQNRLQNGKEEFEQIVQMVLDALIKMSALDLTLGKSSTEMIQISEKLFGVAERIQDVSHVSTKSAQEVTLAHENLSSTISDISSNAQGILTGINKNEEQLSDIMGISNQTMEKSMEMKNDMDNLMEIIENMMQVINSINNISAQTNLLSLNASIEAARAGEAGKGFAVVAEEIRTLAEETKSLTVNMDEFIGKVHEASQQSSESIANTVKSLNVINEELQSVLASNNENKEQLYLITNDITESAAVSQEISSSVNQVEEQIHLLEEDSNQLEKEAKAMSDASQTIVEVIKPIASIEATLDDSSKLMGVMIEDVFYMLSNSMFANTVKNAVTAHQNWVHSLKTMVQTGVITPLQTDATKCGFGHFYYSMHPKNSTVSDIWISLESKHKNLHELGRSAIQALWDQDQAAADNYAKQATTLSENLIKDFQTIIKNVEDLDKQGIRVFEA